MKAIGTPTVLLLLQIVPMIIARVGKSAERRLTFQQWVDDNDDWNNDDWNNDDWDNDDWGWAGSPSATPSLKGDHVGSDNAAEGSNVINNDGPVCADPLTAVLDTLQCVQDEDARCAAAGYSRREFRKIHNGVDTGTTISFGFWSGAFAILDFEIAIDHAFQYAPNQVSVRYVEKVTTTNGENLFLGVSSEYPFQQTFFQHEHALVTVDEDCKIVLWDQYGDDKEQQDVEDVADAIVCVVNPVC